MNSWMIYGATGYTGKLIVAEAVRRGMKPVISGRSADKVAAVAGEYGLDHVAFSVDDTAAMDAAIKGKALVLNVAGPFSATAEAVSDACIRAGAHYLDVTGEIDVFEAMAAKSNVAGAAGVMLMPGVGFDVVPSDCLAAHVAARLPSANSLRLAIAGLGSASQGTAKTGVESLGNGTAVRRGGAIEYLKKAPRRSFDYGEGATDFLAVSWGDVSTAWHSTHIDDIEVYFEASKQMRQMDAMGRWLGPLVRTNGFKNFLKKQIDKMPAGPNEAARAEESSTLYALATDKDGASASAALKVPNGYTLTAQTAVEIAARVLVGDFKAGYQTPSKAYGADFILDFDLSERRDLD